MVGNAGVLLTRIEYVKRGAEKNFLIVDAAMNDLIRPTLLVLMGRFAAHALLETEASIASMRGRVHRYRDTPAIVTYHPAYLLRTPADKSKAWEDLLFARATWAGLQSVPDAST